MTRPAKPVSHGPMSRAEKMSILSSLLGPDALARLHEGQEENRTVSLPVDAERAAWQRNKLLERLRQQDGENTVSPEAALGQPLKAKHPANGDAHAGAQRRLGGATPHLDAQLAKLFDPAKLAQEHPAIIARLVQSLSRDKRVDVLKSLPGPIARSIVQRLR